MEQAKYWMWAKPNYKPDSIDPNNNNNNNIFSPMNSYGDSWEEQAFAEDAAGALGGCVWPPRSYSCSFCRREFRSAQALGGHMNVHRRDRARLKQSPAPSQELVPQINRALTTCTPQICCSSSITTPFYNNSNPNPEFSEPRVSSPPAVKLINSDGNTSALFLSSPPLVSHKNEVVLMGQPSSWSSFVTKNRNKRFDRDLGAEKEDYVTEDLVGCRKTRADTCSDEKAASYKRRKIEENYPSSLFPNRSCVAPQSAGLKLCQGPSEELDLELRLGFSVPKVK